MPPFRMGRPAKNQGKWTQTQLGRPHWGTLRDPPVDNGWALPGAHTGNGPSRGTPSGSEIPALMGRRAIFFVRWHGGIVPKNQTTTGLQCEPASQPNRRGLPFLGSGQDPATEPTRTRELGHPGWVYRIQRRRRSWPLFTSPWRTGFWWLWPPPQRSGLHRGRPGIPPREGVLLSSTPRGNPSPTRPRNPTWRSGAFGSRLWKRSSAAGPVSW